jgi:integrase
VLTHDVVFWKIRVRKDRPKPYQVRWKVGTVPQAKSFLTRALADDFRADLLKAARRGELFDTTGGLPTSMTTVEKVSQTWFDFARSYVAMRWPRAAAKTRDSIVDSLATSTLALLAGEAAELDAADVRAAMRWALVPRGDDAEVPCQHAVALRHLTKGTRTVADLADPIVIRQVLDTLATKLDGTPTAADTASRRRRGLNTALEYAVDLGELSENPLGRIKRTKVARDGMVDRRVVVNPRQAQELLTALTYVGSWHRARGRRLVAFFATLYMAGVRPAEAVGLRESDCRLPKSGWGLLELDVTRPSAGKQWTDTGEVHDTRGLKQRTDRETRPVPAPPALVKILRDHIDEFGTAKDGRLFANERSGVLGSSSYSRAWEEARQLAFTPQQVASPLAGRPYDLRHAALSTWLNAGVDPTDVAERAGNSVEVLLKRYAKCLDGRHDRNNRLIEEALGDQDEHK